MNGTLAILNQAAQSPKMLAIVSEATSYEPTLEITRQEKEIERIPLLKLFQNSDEL